MYIYIYIYRERERNENTYIQIKTRINIARGVNFMCSCDVQWFALSDDTKLYTSQSTLTKP